MVSVDPAELEQLNKNVRRGVCTALIAANWCYVPQVIKKSAKDILTKRGYSVDHPEYKEIWNWVQRGVAFATVRFMLLSTRVINEPECLHL